MPLAQDVSKVFSTCKPLRGYGFTPEVSDPEQEMADALSLYSKVTWYQQVPFETSFGTFYLDVGGRVTPTRAIGIECDGRAFHQDKLRDFCRDALILGTGRLSCIYRMDAWAVRKRRFDWIRLLVELEPEIFDAGRAQVIRELNMGFDKMIGLDLQKRGLRFLSRRIPQMASVHRFLEFAKCNQGITFPQLVERAREAELASGRTGDSVDSVLSSPIQ